MIVFKRESSIMALSHLAIAKQGAEEYTCSYVSTRQTPSSKPVTDLFPLLARMTEKRGGITTWKGK